MEKSRNTFKRPSSRALAVRAGRKFSRYIITGKANAGKQLHFVVFTYSEAMGIDLVNGTVSGVRKIDNKKIVLRSFCNSEIHDK